MRTKRLDGAWRGGLLGVAAVSLIALGAVVTAPTASADMAAAEKWIDEEFQPSTLSREE